MLLYIDPGTGSMLFSILIGIVGTLVFFGQQVVLKIKFIISGGKVQKINSSKIPCVIFTEDKRYWNIFKPICDEFERRKTPVVCWTACPADPCLTEKYEYVKTEFIGEGNKAYARLNMMNARIVLATTPSLDVYQWKRSKNVDRYVHIPHSVDELLGYRMFGLDFFDAVLLSGEFQKKYIRALEKMRNTKEKELVVVGSTYIDTMAVKRDTLAVSKQQVQKDGIPHILLAPSWGTKAILTKFGEKLIDILVATGFDITIRPHPQSFISEKNIIEPLQRKYPDSEHLHWNRDNDNFNVLAASDILITDFSAITLDYALVFEKPIICAASPADNAPYDSAWFAEPVWRLQIVPEIGYWLDEKDFPRLKQIIEHALTSSEFKANIKRISDEAWQNKGHAAEAVVDYLTREEN